MAGHKPPPGRCGNREESGLRPKQARHSPKGERLLDADTAAESDEIAWFTEPWRDGYIAIRLLETLGILGLGHALPTALQSTLTRPANEMTAADYAALERAGLEAGLLRGTDGVVHPAAASCLANWIANSHGGGHVPNVYLRSTVGWLLWHGLDPEIARWEIGRARAVDLCLSTADGTATEFMRLWHRRQYGAAWRLRSR